MLLVGDQFPETNNSFAFIIQSVVLRVISLLQLFVQSINRITMNKYEIW